MRRRNLISTAVLSFALFGLAACSSGSPPDAASTDDLPPLINPSSSDPEASPTASSDLPQPATPSDVPQTSALDDPAPAAEDPGLPLSDVDADVEADVDAADEPPAPPNTETPDETVPPEPAGLLIRPSQFPQPSSFATLDIIPRRPDAFSDYGRVAIPWLQGRITVEDILPLFEAWRMPPVSGGFRLNLVDTNGDAVFPGDGRSAIVIVYTDPPTADIATGFSNLVVYEPLGGSPGAFRIVYDHDHFEQSLGATFGRSGIAVTAVTDANGDGLRDISFEELICNNEGCRRISYVLSNVDGEDGNAADTYRRVEFP